MLFSLLLIVIGIDYLGPEVYIPFLKIPIFLPLALFLFVIAVPAINRRTNSEVIEEVNFRWLIFYMILLCLSIATADVTFYAFKFFQGAFGYFILYFLLVKIVVDTKKLKILFFTLIAVHVLLAVLNPDVLLDPAHRNYLKHPSFSGDGNDFAWSVTICVPLSLYMFLESDKLFSKVVFGLSGLILLGIIIASQSRGAALAIICVFFYLWLKSGSKIKGVILLCVVFLSVLAFAPPAYFTRIESIKEYESDGSAQGRLLAWSSAIQMAKENPLLGVGVDHFSVAFGTRYRPPGIGRTEMAWLNAHSIFFKTLGELGLPGILFLLGSIFHNFYLNRKLLNELQDNSNNASLSYRRLLICLNASLIGWAVAGFFLSGVNYPHMYMLYGIHSSIRLMITQELQEVVEEEMLIAEGGAYAGANGRAA